ncbi:MAG TPA: HEAT repeat domain-containing protein, partial [Thermoanaerobaculia bacterium]|nr:HEAT repeat domain-containing protein [Thermoanaerobaculia bacterium]
QLLIGIYLLGLLLMAARLLLGLFLRRRVLATARPIADPALDALCGRLSARAGLRRSISVRVSPAIRVPLAIGGHLVVLPEAWSAWESAKLESVLAHELAHLRRADPWIHLLGQVNRCIYWFHPVAWVIPQRLSELAERICDELAVSWTGRRSSYARHLVEIAAALQGRDGRVVFGSMPMARTSDLRERIESLLDGVPQCRLGQLGRRLVVVIIAGMVLSVGAVRVEAERPRPLGASERAAAVTGLSSADAGKRAGAARKLREAQAVSAEVVPALVRMLGDRTPVRIRLEATDPGKEAAQALGEAGEITIDALRKALGSASPEVRRDAASALGVTQSPLALQPLLGALGDKVSRVRERVVWALGALEREEAVKPLVAALADENAEVRASAARSLGWIESREALPALRKAAQADADKEVRSRAARAVELIEASRAEQGLTEAEKDSVPELMAALRHEDYEVREEAAEALGGLADRAAVAALAKALKDEEYTVGQTSAWALGQIGDPAAIGPLTAALRDSDDRVRASAAEALGRIGGPQVIPALEQALRDGEAEVRMEAIRALLSTEGPRALAALRQALSDDDPRVRRQAGLAMKVAEKSATLTDLETALADDDYRIRKIAAAGFERMTLSKAPDALLHTLHEDTSKTVREIAARALGKLHDPRATSALIMALQDERWEVRQQAAASLGQIRDPQAAAALTSAQKDEHPRVRAQAAAALQRLRSAA